MAEAVGIAAAAVQFIELGTKLLIAACKLRSKLENAPERVKTSERSVKQLVSLVRTLEADLHPASTTTLANVLTAESKLEAQHILEDCSKDASALLDLLQSFMFKADDNFVKGKMRAFSYIKKEEEVAERCKRLDELSSRLVLWYHHQILSLQKKQLETLFSTNVAINAIGSQMNAGFAAVAHSLQLQQGAMTLSLSAPMPRTDSSLVFRHTLGRSGLGIAYLPRCSCTRPYLMKSTSKVGPFSLMSKQSGIHERSCPFYGKNQTRASRITIGFSLPSLFAERVELSFASSYAKGAYSIFPTVRTVNIVDGRESSAFKHLESGWWSVRSLLGESSGKSFWFAIDTSLISPLQEILETLLMELEEDFRSGVSSAMDVTSDGTSMLHCLFEILGIVSVYQDHLAELAASLLQLLIDFGIDINAERQVSYNGSPKGENALSLLKDLVDMAYMERRDDTSLQFISLLYRRGIDVPGWEKHCNTSFLEPTLFPKLPDIALEEVGFPRLTFAVICRDEHNLRSLIRAGHNVHETYIQPFTPLCYSTGWPEGCQILLESGADPNAALSTAFTHLDVAMMKRLLEAGCALFANESPLGRFLWSTRFCIGSEDKRSEILSLLINTMADFRRRFMQLAHENAPRQALIQHGWTEPSPNGPLLDGSAGRIAKLLDSLKIRIPRNINPGVMPSVYHQQHLTSEASQLLYSCGFTGIDLPDRNGCTPFMLCLIRIGIYLDQNVRKIPTLWFLDQGISIVYCSSIPGFNLLHLLSACFRKGVFSRIICHQKGAKEFDDFDTVVHRLSRLCDPYSRDSCKCWCSNGGCLPLTLLFKRLWPVWSRFQYLGNLKRRCISWGAINQTLNDWMRWYGCDLDDRTLLEGICRLEIFQRLGMAHTCCKLKMPFDAALGYNTLSASFVSEPERQQLQEEDICSKVQLDALLDTYTALFTQYPDSVARFWMVWWEILEEYLPQRVWILEEDGGEEYEHEDEDEDEYTGLHYVTLENPWCNSDLPEPQDLWTKTDEIKTRVIVIMTELESRNLAS